jgi:Fe-S cluster assembly ATP-binding protein
MSTTLAITHLFAGIENKQIIQDINLNITTGQVVALMGKNGSGKSTLSHVIMGNPVYQVTGGKIMFKGKNILRLSVHDRARLGIFLAFQYPLEIPGLSVFHFLQTSAKAIQGKKFKPSVFQKELIATCLELKLSQQFLERGLNEGFSGGEKKRMEILQLKILKPQIAILDETDSGLDIDALKLVASNVRGLVGKNFGVLVITHYQRLLNFLKPDQVHIMSGGKIITSGDKELAKKLEKEGYDWLEK